MKGPPETVRRGAASACMAAYASSTSADILQTISGNGRAVLFTGSVAKCAHIGGAFEDIDIIVQEGAPAFDPDIFAQGHKQVMFNSPLLGQVTLQQYTHKNTGVKVDVLVVDPDQFRALWKRDSQDIGYIRVMTINWLIKAYTEMLSDPMPSQKNKAALRILEIAMSFIGKLDNPFWTTPAVRLIPSLTFMHNRLRDIAMDWEFKVRELTEGLLRRDSDISVLRAELRIRVKSLEDLGVRNAGLAEEVVSLREKAKTLEETLARNAALADEIIALRANIVTHVEVARRQRVSVESLEKVVSDSARNNASLLAELDQKARTVEELRSELASVRASLKSSQKTVARLKNDGDVQLLLEDTRRQLEEERCAAAAAADRHAAHVSETMGKVQRCMRDVDEMKSSLKMVTAANKDARAVSTTMACALWAFSTVAQLNARGFKLQGVFSYDGSCDEDEDDVAELEEGSLFMLRESVADIMGRSNYLPLLQPEAADLSNKAMFTLTAPVGDTGNSLGHIITEVVGSGVLVQCNILVAVVDRESTIVLYTAVPSTSMASRHIVLKMMARIVCAGHSMALHSRTEERDWLRDHFLSALTAIMAPHLNGMFHPKTLFAALKNAIGHMAPRK